VSEQSRQKGQFDHAAAEFKLAAESYVNFITAAPEMGLKTFIGEGLCHLATLFSLALQLPGENYPPDPDMEISLLSKAGKEREKRLESDLASFLGYNDLYWTADPTSDAREAVPLEAGSLAEDLSEIYGALVAGLVAAREGRSAVAISTWSWSYWSYWGEHAADAMRALFASARVHARGD
jgi:hypothetical protein